MDTIPASALVTGTDVVIDGIRSRVVIVAWCCDGSVAFWTTPCHVEGLLREHHVDADTEILLG